MKHRLQLPDNPVALLVLAHGAGAGMDHPFLQSVADGLAVRQIGTFRYEFPYMEAKKHRPDAPAVAAARVREAVTAAAAAAPRVRLFAGGKSFGGRMTSTAQAEAPLPGVRGLVFLGFPLHAPGKPGIERAAHLALVKIPMLFVQGTRDDFARPDLLAPVIESLGAEATLHPVEGGDHSFKIPKSAGRSAMEEICDAVTSWVRSVPSS